jgi:hypothetical protein
MDFWPVMPALTTELPAGPTSARWAADAGGGADKLAVPPSAWAPGSLMLAGEGEGPNTSLPLAWATAM